MSSDVAGVDMLGTNRCDQCVCMVQCSLRPQKPEGSLGPGRAPRLSHRPLLPGNRSGSNRAMPPVLESVCAPHTAGVAAGTVH